MQHFEEETFVKKEFDKRTWKRIISFMRPLRLYVAVVILCGVLLAVADIAYPLINRYGIDVIIASGDLSALPFFIGVYVVFMIVMGILVYTFIYFAEKVQNHLAHIIRKKAFEKLQELPFSYYDRTPAGWIVARMTSDTRQLSDILSWGLIDITWGGLMMVGLATMMLILNWQLALIALSVMPLLVYLSMFFRKRILRAYRDIRKQNSKITGAFNEGILGAKTTKTLVLEEKNYADFDYLTSRMKKHSVRAALFAGLYFPTILFLASIATALVLYFGGLDVRDEVIQVGLLYVFLSYISQFFEPVMQLANVLAHFQQAQASAERVVSLIDQEVEIDDTAGVKEHYGTILEPKRANFASITGRITFENVSFRYTKGEEVLKEFSLDIAAGETVALVGSTGAGKSTIVNLVCRFYEPSSGRILVDGGDYRERSLSWLHSHLGYVLQTPELFSGTIRENIRYGKLDATEEEIVRAAKMVGAHDFIATFQKGYDTEVQEGGSRLSVGQKQLVSFARALIRDPAILILDEATSSVDTTTEKRLQKAIETIMAGRTAIVIAPRLSTVTAADKILVLEHGEVIEAGTHEELLERRGNYFKLYTNQFADLSA